MSTIKSEMKSNVATNEAFSRANMAKRSATEAFAVPSGFKQLDNENKSIVWAGKFANKRIELNKVPIKEVGYIDDKKTNFKIHVSTEHMGQDLEALRTIDATLADAAKEDSDAPIHRALINETNGTVKLSVTLGTKTRDKSLKKKLIQSSTDEYFVTGNFGLSSIYKYQGSFGINLIIPKDEKKVVIAEKPKAEDKTEEEPEDVKEE